MNDLIITGAVVVDGTGAPQRQADVAVSGDRITAVGKQLGSAHRTINGEGLVLTPGWVDIHTHYDGQITWDSELAPSSINGVTSILVGNCGVGFAPARPDKHNWLISLLEGVEDIPGSALAEGMTWGWESFPEYLDQLDKRQWTMDVGTQVPHAALRAYVMGERGADHVERASTADIAQMRALCAASIRAGALGFASSRTTAHRTSTGQIIGTLSASADEVLGIIGGLAEVGKGVVQLISDVYHTGDPELAAAELNLLSRIALESRRPMSFSVQQYDETPDRYRELLAAIDGWCARGANVKAQVAVRPIGVLIGLTASASPLNHCPTYRKQIRLLPLDQQVALLRQTEVRQRLLAEHAAALPKGFQQIIHSRYDRMYPLTEPLDYEPIVQNSVAGIAASTGKAPMEVLYDLMLADDGKRLLYIPLLNYARGSLDDVYEMLKAPNALIGLSDAGAHCNAISDGSMPTTALTHWTRDRTRGPLISLEHMVHLQTQKTAAHVGWHDRGVIAPGYLADLNLIDMRALNSRAPHLVADLPAGGTRLMQEASGYRATIKSGVVTAADGVLTGQTPGRLQRGGKKLATTN